jgi:LmbE family N-acetylglucosaminyl deacetylase
MLAIAAHPDDIESLCAGTLASALDHGASVQLLLVTSGDKGSSDPHSTSAAVGSRREQEALDAAQVLGIAKVAFLRWRPSIHSRATG